METIAKPKLRGVLHQCAAPVAAAAGTLLVVGAPNPRAAWAAAAYALSLLTLFVVSASYHRVSWKPRARAWMRRLDHSAIYLLIAGTYTPIAVVGLPPGEGGRIAATVWGGALLGILVALFWVRAPKLVTAGLCLAVGWAVVPYLGTVRRALDGRELGLILAGGAFYTLGALAYASGRPKLRPDLFGHHELFHVCTIIGAGLHFAAISLILRQG